jgi:hypothetical protein
MAKQILLILLINLSVFKLNAQDSKILVDGKLFIDNFYLDKTQRIISMKTYQFDTLKKAEIIKRIKNWTSINLINMKESLVGETDEQMVFTYISNSFYSKSLGIRFLEPWNIRLVIQIKDTRIRCTFFDDGNAVSPSKKIDRAWTLGSYCFKNSDGKMESRKIFEEGLIVLLQDIDKTFESLIINVSNANKNNDW